MADASQMFIDGAWQDAADGATFDTFDPATGAVLASVPAATAVDVDRAVLAARRAFDDGTWGSAVSERDRARLLFAVAEGVRRRREDLAELEVLDCGKPLVDALADIDEVAFMFEHYGGWATRITGRALTTARAVRAGVVWINDSQPAPSEAMWGGFKQSGIGRELGPYALDAYLESKQIYINLT
jgi:acyl-CoA reductase-like NAD-dependent aldehyde dehydrogenase